MKLLISGGYLITLAIAAAIFLQLKLAAIPVGLAVALILIGIAGMVFMLAGLMIAWSDQFETGKP